MRILSSIVLPSPALMPTFNPKLSSRGAVRSQVVGDHPLRNKGILLQELAHQFQRGVLVSRGLDQHIEDLALGVDGPPEIDHTAVDFQIDLVEMPSRMRLQTTLSQVGRDHRSEMVHPTPNGLVRHRHSALRQQILDVTQAEGEPEVEPYCLVNDLGRETIPGVADLVHPRWATRPPRTPQAQSAVTMPHRGRDLPSSHHHAAKSRDRPGLHRPLEPNRHLDFITCESEPHFHVKRHRRRYCRLAEATMAMPASIISMPKMSQKSIFSPVTQAETVSPTTGTASIALEVVVAGRRRLASTTAQKAKAVARTPM